MSGVGLFAMRKSMWALLLSLVFVPQAFALNVADTTVIIPIIGRFAGAPPSVWRTDLFVANPYSPVAVVTMKFFVAGGSTLQQTITIQPYSTVTLRDVVLNTFGLSSASGELELSCTTSIEARARVYNVGSSVGEFGQSEAGVGKIALRIQAFMHGLSGINGNRLNIGVTNPNDVAITVTLRIADKNNAQLHSRSVPLAAHQNVQFNDIFATFGIAAQEGVSVEFMNSAGPQVIYGYASEVRNDSGDAIFVFGTAPNA